MTAYNDPAQLGLFIIGEVHWHDEPYEFDLTVVWRDEKTGQLYYADDSGCSCPGWFEDFHKVADLTKATSMEIAKHLEERLGDTFRPAYPGAQGQVADLMLKVVSL